MRIDYRVRTQDEKLSADELFKDLHPEHSADKQGFYRLLSKADLWECDEKPGHTSQTGARKEGHQKDGKISLVEYLACKEQTRRDPIHFPPDASGKHSTVMPEEDLARWAERDGRLFTLADADGNGVLDAAELLLLHEHDQNTRSHSEAAKLLQHADGNGDGTLAIEEFLGLGTHIDKPMDRYLSHVGEL